MTRIKLYSLSATERLKSRKQIEQVFAEGKAINMFPFRMGYKLFTAGENGVKAGFSVSTRNFKKSVDRNLIKRRMREAYRKLKPALNDFAIEKKISLAVFLIYTGRELPDQAFVTEKTGEVIERLIKRINEKASGNT